MKHKFKESLLFFVVVICSILLVSFYVGFDIGMYSEDDNINQWGPIVEKTFDTLFEEGYFPTIDYYQYKGFICIDEGVYGILNPIMFFCYLISKFVLSRAIDTISLYVLLCFAFGNGFQYLLLKKCRFSTKIALLTVLLLASSTPFVYFAFWYNVMNIYLMVPILLITLIYMDKGRLGYYMSGVVLAFGLQLGHVQYDFYLYIIFGFVSIVLVLFYDRKLIRKVMSNLGTAILLSMPSLYAMLLANGRRNETNSSGSMFDWALSPVQQFIYSIFPKIVTDNVSILDSLWKFESGLERTKCVYTPLYLIGYILLLWVCFIKLIRFVKQNKELELKDFKHSIKKQCKSFEKNEYYLLLFGIGIVLSSLFFINYALGEDGIVAIVLNQIPVINSFRFALKAVFTYIPLLVVPTAFLIKIVLKKYKNNRLKQYIIMCLLLLIVLVGVFNNFDTNTNGKNLWTGRPGNLDIFEARDVALQIMEDSRIRKNEFRLISILNTSLGSYRREKDIIATEGPFYSRNRSTMVESYSLAGHDVAADDIVYESCSSIFAENKESFATVVGVSGNDILMNSTNQKYCEKLENQIKSNSVKYVVIQKDGEALENLVNIFERMETVSIISRKDYDEYNIILELDGIRPLCSNDDDKSFPLMNDMGRLRANVDDSKNIYLSFMYREEMQGSLISEDGQKHRIALSADQNGHIIARNDTGIPGELRITYHNGLHAILVVFAILITILLVLLGIVLFEKE